MFMYVYIVCRVASQGWSRMILYLWSFYSRSYFANYSLPPSVNIHRSDRRQADYRLQGPYSIPWGLRSVTQTTDTQRPPVSPGVWPVFTVFTVLSVIRNTKIFVSRCLEATGAQTRPYRPHNATIHPAIYSPAKYDLFELFMIFLFDHKVSFNWARSRTAWLTDSRAQAAILVFIAVPAIYRDSLLPGSSEQSPDLWLDTTCLTSHTGPGELWPSWNLSGSDWHFRHMDGLTPKKLDPNKMLTQEAK